MQRLPHRRNASSAGQHQRAVDVPEHGQLVSFPSHIPPQTLYWKATATGGPVVRPKKETAATRMSNGRFEFYQ
jgi:hypothetical protein